MNQEKIAMENCIKLLTKKNNKLNTPSVQAAVAVLRKALMGGSHKEELFEIANEIISSCSDPETGVATLSWSNTSNSIGKNSVRYVLQIFSKRPCYVFSYIYFFRYVKITTGKLKSNALKASRDKYLKRKANQMFAL